LPVRPPSGVLWDCDGVGPKLPREDGVGTRGSGEMEKSGMDWIEWRETVCPEMN